MRQRNESRRLTLGPQRLLDPAPGEDYATAAVCAKRRVRAWRHVYTSVVQDMITRTSRGRNHKSTPTTSRYDNDNVAGLLRGDHSYDHPQDSPSTGYVRPLVSILPTKRIN